jgi:hypothetical protein
MQRAAYIIARMTYSQLLKYYGSQSAIAAAVKIKQPSVAEWRIKGVPGLRQIQFQRMTGLKADRAVVRKYRKLLEGLAA